MSTAMNVSSTTGGYVSFPEYPDVEMVMMVREHDLSLVELRRLLCGSENVSVRLSYVMKRERPVLRVDGLPRTLDVREMGTDGFVSLDAMEILLTWEIAHALVYDMTLPILSEESYDLLGVYFYEYYLSRDLCTRLIPVPSGIVVDMPILGKIYDYMIHRNLRPGPSDPTRLKIGGLFSS